MSETKKRRPTTRAAGHALRPAYYPGIVVDRWHCQCGHDLGPGSLSKTTATELQRVHVQVVLVGGTTA